MDWEINIKKVDNGFLLLIPFEDEEGKRDFREEVIEEGVVSHTSFKTLDEDKITLGRLLYRIAEYFGEIEQRYGNDNLSINFDREGSKYEGKE